jgi:hypothetical protein
MPIPPNELRQHLNGLRAMTSWAILTLHTTNARAVRDGVILADGTLLFEALRDGPYWRHLERPYPGYLHFWREQSFETDELRAAILSSAEHRLFINMVAEAYEMAKASANTNPGVLWQRFTSAPWSQFARVVRNVANHNLIVEEPNGVTFPITWNGLTFTRAMIDHDLTIIGFFDMDKAFELVEDIARYADNDFNAPANAQEAPRAAPLS